jgi:hypothetical protein
VRLVVRVAQVQASSVVTEDGKHHRARAVVVATDGPTAHHLLGDNVADPGSRAVACCWYTTPQPPLRGAVLMLDGDRSGPAKNVVVMSEVSPSNARAGSALVAAAVPRPAALDPMITVRVGDQLARWFGPSTRDWEHRGPMSFPTGSPASDRPCIPSGG